MKTTRNLIVAFFVALPFMSIASIPHVSKAMPHQTPADSVLSAPQHAVIDEVIWVVGDEAVLKSDVEAMRMQAAMEGVKWNGDPDCTIPEQIAVNNSFSIRLISTVLR